MKKAIKRLLFGDRDIDYSFKRGILKGLKFRINPMNKFQRILGLDEREIESIARRFASKAKSAVDVGANDGWYTLFFASSPSIRRVVACEPESKYGEAFNHNFRINPAVDFGKVRMVKAFVGTGGHDGFVPLDSLTRDLEEPILLKIDVDGGEVDVLKSGVEALSKSRTLVIIETHSPQLELDCVSHLEGLGFRVCIVKNAWYRAFIKDLRPIEQNRWLFAYREGV